MLQSRGRFKTLAWLNEVKIRRCSACRRMNRTTNPREKTTMTIFDPARGRVIDGGGGSGFGLLRLIGLGLAAFLLVILLFSSVTKVATGHVGVLTLFGKVQTGETLGEGIHLISPLKTNNEL